MKGRFIKYLRFEKRLSENTVISYETDLNQFLSFYKEYSTSQKIEKVDKRTIRSWIVKLSLSNLSAKSINRKIASLKSFFKFLVKRDLIKKNPSSHVTSLKTDQKIPTFIKEKDINFLFKNIDVKEDCTGQRDLLILELLYGTGIRISELINIKISDINFAKKEIKVIGKRNKERIIPLHNNAIYQTKKYLQLAEKEGYKNQYLLFTKKGEKIYSMLINRIVKKHLSTLIKSKKYNPHLLRHTFATHILNKGGDLNSIKDLLGHSSLAATQVYTHNSIEKLKEAFNSSHPRA
tara:strand:- start:13094 stop:13969 length:876 start_codon:yes stop_codon:yes gene_type:complete